MVMFSGYNMFLYLQHLGWLPAKDKKYFIVNEYFLITYMETNRAIFRFMKNVSVYIIQVTIILQF